MVQADILLMTMTTTREPCWISIKQKNEVLSSGVVANIYLAERMASAEREPITGVWGAEPPVGARGAEPLVEAGV